jgi:hypothetical protein
MGNRTPGSGNLTMQTTRDVELRGSIESLRSVGMGGPVLDCLGGSNAYALCKLPHLGGNLFCVPAWESVFPKGGPYEVRAECAVTGA